MFKKEFKEVFKPTLIFTIIIALMFGVIILLYPYMMGDITNQIDELLNTMPEGLLKAFNMDLLSISKASGWVLSEGYMMLTLAGAIFFGFIGSNILLKEETSKTIFFLATKPVKRNDILRTKILAGLLCILLFNIVVSGIMFITLLIVEEQLLKQMIILFVSSFLIDTLLFMISLMVSTFMYKGGVTIGISMAVVFISYILLIVSKISDKVENIKYASIFFYSDSKFIIDNNFNVINYLVLISLCVISFVVSLKKYNRKELF